MATATLADPIKSMARDRSALKAYAQRVIAQGEVLSPGEEADRVYLMREFMFLGVAFKCTEHELVTLVLKECSETPRNCDCPHCRARNEAYCGAM